MVRIVIIIFLLLPKIIAGKTRHLSSSDLSFLANKREMIKNLEGRFKPILEHKTSRIKRSRGFSSNLRQKFFPDTIGPSDKDFLLLVQLWDDLNPEFKSLYKSAATIPDSFLTIISPGGHFDISYSLKGADAVDSTDNYGYSRLNWRLREENPNKIPDYIDEVGWALDSCWSVQIDRFGLRAPAPFLKNGTSERYSVIVEEQYPYDYGLTWVGEKATNSPKGYSSYISLRNNWPSTYWEEQGYDKHPQSGIRVTCAHEFFHAVQYAMSWNVISRNGLLYLDKFPLSWIEGSATAMEEFLFKDINDYIQYANFYFSYPGPKMSFLDGSNDVYTNSILLLYLLKVTAHVNNNNFITIVHKNNFKASMDFNQNINSAAKSFGFNWTTLLNDFHTASYFSAYLADTNRFLGDAALFGHWSFQENSSVRAGTTKLINPYAMEKYYIKRFDSDIDTLNISFHNETENQNKLWAASIIINRNKGDTVIPVQLDAKSNGFCQIKEWKNADYALAIVSNGNPEQALSYSVWFEHSDVNYFAESNNPPEKIVVYPNRVHLRRLKSDSIFICGVAVTDLRVYGLDGSIKYEGSPSQNSNFRKISHQVPKYSWIIPKEHFSPGLYSMAVRYKDKSGKRKTSIQKIIIAP